MKFLSLTVVIALLVAASAAFVSNESKGAAGLRLPLSVGQHQPSPR
jgi:hypothetical protein